jgi:hypothetical protein
VSYRNDLVKRPYRASANQRWPGPYSRIEAQYQELQNCWAHIYQQAALQVGHFCDLLLVTWVDLHQWRAIPDVYFAEMSFAENKRDAIESRLRDARPQIVDQYERVRHAADAWEIQLNATVLVNMLLVFNFMSRQILNVSRL